MDYNGYNLLLNVVIFWGYVLFLNFTKNTINLIIYNLIFKYIDYVRLSPIEQDVKDLTFSQHISMNSLSNVPEAFKEKYFPKKEVVENLLELKDIINNL